MTPFQYRVTFFINGRRTEQIVNAICVTDARKLIEAQYAGQKLSIYEVKKI